MQALTPRSSGSSTMAATPPTASELGQLWLEVNDLFQKNSGNRQLAVPMRAFDSWRRQAVERTTSSALVTVRNPNESAKVESFLRAIKLELESIKGQSDASAVTVLVGKITVNIQNLHNIRSDAVAGASQPNAKRAGHNYRSNRIEKNAKAQFSDSVAADYNGQFMDTINTYEDNVVTDDAKALYGTKYGGKDFWDD